MTRPRLKTALYLLLIIVCQDVSFVIGETFVLAYITGSRRTTSNVEYNRPGLQISGAMTLAVDEINAGPLAKRGHKLEFLVGETYGNADKSIFLTAEMWSKNVSGYIGPQETCIHEARMAAAFNLPMISYYCSSRETSNKKEFPTFVRTRPPDTQISKSVISVLKIFNWTRISFMFMNASKFETYEIPPVAETLLSSFSDAGIEVSSVKCWNETYRIVEELDNPFHKLVAETYTTTRIYVVLGDIEEHIGLLMALDKKKLLGAGEYFVLGINTETYNSREPNTYFRSLYKRYTTATSIALLQNYFCVISSAAIQYVNFTNKVHDYRQRPPFNFKNPFEVYKKDAKVQTVPETAYLYDAVHLYAYSLIKALDEGRDPLNGRALISSLFGYHYHSAMGYMVYMDQNGDPEGNYTLIAQSIRPLTGHGMYPIGYFVGKDKYTNLPRLRFTQKIKWVGHKPPLAEPYCGFDGRRCYSRFQQVVYAGGICIVLLITVVLYSSYRSVKYEEELDQLLWKISFRDIQLAESSNNRNDSQTDDNAPNPTDNAGQPPVRSSQASLSSNPDTDFRYSMIYTQVGIYKGGIYAVKKINKRSIEMSRDIKKELKIMRDVRHDNLNAFIGACIDPPNICIITEYCHRGSLKDVLDNYETKLDNMFKASFIGDIVRGMIYLQDSAVKYHGSLTTSNCLVDSRWVVKLSDFGLHEFKRFSRYNPEDVNKMLYSMQYRAPEVLRSLDFELSPKDLQKSDVYSFSIVLYELNGRHGPFGILPMSVKEILRRVMLVRTDHPPFRPSLDQLENCFDCVRECLIECWDENPDVRPDFKMIRTKLRPLKKGMKSNICDNMMTMMEKYANNLESLVDERTFQLTEEKKKTDALLYEMLPRPVAEQLKRGHKVEAENFDCVTIYFSDIVGFTSMCATSTPLEVVNFLNDLYTCFDSIIQNYDVYKVETIGDAYMVVSGLPLRNGDNHAAEIASMSLSLLEAVEKFTIRHKPEERLQLRIGIHSGPVCAGVVGLKMPRYCLFGDTVNTASRMESSGLPGRIHCSKPTKNLLDQLGGYVLERRGSTSLKGKGYNITYWLNSEDESIQYARNQERMSQRETTVSIHNVPQSSSSDLPPPLSPPVPRSSLKNKSFTKPAFSKYLSESPKRLRFASSDHLNQPARAHGSKDEESIELDCIVRSSPNDAEASCSYGHSSCTNRPSDGSHGDVFTLSW